MKQAKYDINIWTGRVCNEQFALIDRNGDRVNLSGYSFAAEIKTQAFADVVSFTTAIDDAAAGEVSISLTAAQTAALTPGRYVWDMMLTNGDGDKLPPYIGGGVRVETGVTD